jgi:hypothetical protein
MQLDEFNMKYERGNAPPGDAPSAAPGNGMLGNRALLSFQANVLDDSINTT